MIYRFHLINGDYLEASSYQKVSYYISFTDTNGKEYEVPWTSILFVEKDPDA